MIAIIALTYNGAILSEIISGFFPNSKIFLNDRISRKIQFKHNNFEKISGLLKKEWNNYDAFVFTMSTGIVVRSIVNLLNDKAIDPAIVVMDEKGNNIISLLSGHLGGANNLTKKIAEKLNANPVITTASDINSLPAFDELARINNFSIKNKETLYRIAVDMLEGNTIDLYSNIEINFNLPANINHKNSVKEFNSAQSNIIISEYKNKDTKSLQIIPKNIIVGIGCRKNTPFENIDLLLKEVLDKTEILPEAILNIATIPLKANEKGILELADKLNMKVDVIPIEKIKKIENKFEGSEFVESIVGVKTVAEPCAYLSAKIPELISHKIAKGGVTIALVKDKSIKMENN